MCNQKIKRWELVELSVPDGATNRVGFNTIPQLRNQANQLIVINDVEIFTEESYKSSQITNTIPGMPPSAVASAVLVLYINGEESVKMIPLAKLNHINSAAGGNFQQELFGFDSLTNVDWDKSYVQFSEAQTPAYVIPFGITYYRLQKDPANPNGPFIQS